MKNKELNVIDFGSGMWGHNIVLDTYNTKGNKVNKAHGWYSRPFIISDTVENKGILKKGSLIRKDAANNGNWFARVVDIEWCNDPGDMFFCKVKTIIKTRQLSKKELAYIENKYGDKNA